MAVEVYPRRDYWEQRGLAWLWFAVLAGPAAVAANQLGGYALVKWACASRHTYVLTGINIAALGLALAGAWAGWTCRARLGDATEYGGRIIDRSYFVAIVGIGLALINALLVVMQTYPRFILSPCE